LGRSGTRRRRPPIPSEELTAAQDCVVNVFVSVFWAYEPSLLRPVGFHFDGEAFFVGSSMMDKTHKGKNIAAGNVLVSVTVDDLVSTDPYEPRGIKIHGKAGFVEPDEAPDVGAGSRRFIRIRPIRSWSFGILEPGFQDGKWTTSKVTWPMPT
jgi:pyridoxamine 5'-phosphate oxidase family protein